MGIKHYKLPDVGEGLVEAEIVSWRVKVGDTIKVNDIVVEIETAKSLVELPSPYAGVVHELMVEEGITVDVGTPIIALQTEGGDDAPAPAAPAKAEESDEPKEGERQAVLVGYGPRSGAAKRRARKGAAAPASAPAAPAPVAPAPVAQAPVAPPAPAPVAAPAPAAAPASGATVRALAKPPVRKLAKDMGIDLRDVPASGAGGIVTRDDVMAFQSAGGAVAPVAGMVAAQPGERETRIPIKGVRKMTAQAMVSSKFTAPHVTEFITVDVTETMNLVARLKADREFQDLKVSPLLVVMKAILIGLKRHPGINATWDEAAGEIIQKHYVNLGIAAATPRGLVVPNIKEAQSKSLMELAADLKSLIKTARDGKTQPAEMQGGTFSITNVGVFGVDTGTPIINPGEAAIFALGAIRETPWVVDGEIKVRWVTQLAMSFDHRLIDGDLGSKFLADVAAILEDPTRGLVWG